MDKKLQELLNRKPIKWGSVSIKEFERDIRFMQETIEQQQEEIERLKKGWKELKETLNKYV